MIKPIKLSNNNLLTSLDMSTEEVVHTLNLAKAFKTKDLQFELNNKTLGLILFIK